MAALSLASLAASLARSAPQHRGRLPLLPRLPSSRRLAASSVLGSRTQIQLQKSSWIASTKRSTAGRCTSIAAKALC